MLMLYFSGTGNSKYIAELFCRYTNAKCYSIEEEIDFETLIAEEETIGFCYPVYLSRVPRNMREFAKKYTETLKGKKLIIFCTQMLLSGDGARAFAAMFPKGHAEVVYAEHFFMPNNFSNLIILPSVSDRQKQKHIACTQRKMQKIFRNIENGIIKKRGFNKGTEKVQFF